MTHLVSRFCNGLCILLRSIGFLHSTGTVAELREKNVTCSFSSVTASCVSSPPSPTPAPRLLRKVPPILSRLLSSDMGRQGKTDVRWKHCLGFAILSPVLMVPGLALYPVSQRVGFGLSSCTGTGTTSFILYAGCFYCYPDGDWRPQMPKLICHSSAFQSARTSWKLYFTTSCNKSRWLWIAHLPIFLSCLPDTYWFSHRKDISAIHPEPWRHWVLADIFPRAFCHTWDLQGTHPS